MKKEYKKRKIALSFNLLIIRVLHNNNAKIIKKCMENFSET